MPLQLKNGPVGGGSWRAAPASGKLALLRGSGDKLNAKILTNAPVAYWPFRDPAGSNVANDVIGTNDSTYTGDVTAGHPNPWKGAGFLHRMVIPGGNPLKWANPAAGQNRISSVEMVVRTTAAGGLFGYQSTAIPTNPTDGYVPALYVGTDGKVRGTVYPIELTDAAGPDIRDGKYHHIVLSHNATSASIWVDGVVTQTKPGTPNFTATYNNNAQIGACYATAFIYEQFPAEGWAYANGADIYYFAVYNKPYTTAMSTASLVPNWYVPATVSVQEGGAWQSASGYVGLPGMPGTPTVLIWDYSAVWTQWTEPTTGAPIDSFEVQLLNSTGGVIATQTAVAGDGNSSTRHDRVFRFLSYDTKYQFRVRTKATTGLYSNWTAPLKVQTGHPEEETTSYEPRTRPWSASASFSNVGNGGLMTVNLPSTVDATQLRVDVETNTGQNPFCGGGYSRHAHWIKAGADIGDVGTKNNPWYETLAWSQTSPGGAGIKLVGDTPTVGWNSIKGQGTITLWGTETYTATIVTTTPAVANKYW